MKYKVTYEYRGTVTVDVEADNEGKAEDAGMQEADEAISRNLSLYDVEVREA